MSFKEPPSWTREDNGQDSNTLSRLLRDSKNVCYGVIGKLPDRSECYFQSPSKGS